MVRRRRSTTSVSSASNTYASPSTSHTGSSGTEHSRNKAVRSISYQKIKMGLRKSVPAAIVLWVFHKLRSRAPDGLTSRRVINFLKQHYKLHDDPSACGKSISAMLRCAVEFGLLEKRHNKYFLVEKTKALI